MKIPWWSVWLLVLLVGGSFFGEFIYTKNPVFFDKNSILLPPSLAYPLGTDRLGRDMLSRMIEGGKISLTVGVASAFAATFVGLAAGLIAGYFRGWTDRVAVAAIDVFLTVPTFFLLLAMVSYVEATSVVLILIIAVTGWMGTARLVRSEVFGIHNKPFIKILKIAKVPTWKILFKYYAPLLSPIVLTSFTFAVGASVLTESALSFLGLGVNPPAMSWGSLLSDGKDVMDIAWWISFFPGLAIFLLTYSLVNISSYLQHRFNSRESAI